MVPPPHVDTLLLPGHVKFAFDTGQRRMEEAEKYNRNDRGLRSLHTRAQNLHREQYSCAGEMALWIYCQPCVWHALAPPGTCFSALPDINDDVDAKTVDKAHHALIVPIDPKKPNGGIKPDWAYVLVKSHRHPIYELHGWVLGDKILA